MFEVGLAGINSTAQFAAAVNTISNDGNCFSPWGAAASCLYISLSPITITIPFSFQDWHVTPCSFHATVYQIRNRALHTSKLTATATETATKSCLIYGAATHNIAIHSHSPHLTSRPRSPLALPSPPQLYLSQPRLRLMEQNS